MSHRRKSKGQEKEETLEERMKYLEKRIDNIFSLDGTKAEIVNIQFMMALMKSYAERNEFLEQQAELLEQNRLMFVEFIHENGLDEIIEKWFKERAKDPEAPPEENPPKQDVPPEVIPPEVQNEENKMSEDNHHNG